MGSSSCSDAEVSWSESEGSASSSEKEGGTFNLTGLKLAAVKKETKEEGKRKEKMEEKGKRDAVVIRYWKAGEEGLKSIKVIKNKLLDVLQWGHKHHHHKNHHHNHHHRNHHKEQKQHHHRLRQHKLFKAGERREHEFPPGVFEPVKNSLYFHFPNHVIVTVGFSFVTTLWAMDGGKVGGLKQGAVINSAYGREESANYRIKIDDHARCSMYGNDGVGGMASAAANRKQSRLNSFFLARRRENVQSRDSVDLQN